MAEQKKACLPVPPPSAPRCGLAESMLGGLVATQELRTVSLSFNLLMPLTSPLNNIIRFYILYVLLFEYLILCVADEHFGRGQESAHS